MMGSLPLLWLQLPGEPLCTSAPEGINQAGNNTSVELRRQRLESGEEEVGGICQKGESCRKWLQRSE